MDKPQENPLTWHICPYCTDKFYGRQDVCLTCRAAIRDGEVLILGRGGDEDDEDTGIRRLTREEVLEMPRGRVAVTAAGGETAPARRLKKASESEISVQIHKTMPGIDLDVMLKAVGAFVATAPDADYTVQILVKKAG